MAQVAPAGFDMQRLRDQVLATYNRVALEPEGNFHFHRGADYACETLRYDRAELAQLPTLATARFAGVGNPHRIGRIEPGETVLDHACGAGTDLLLAARKVGRSGRAIGVDMAPGMRACASEAASQAGVSTWTEVLDGFYEALPLPDECIDVVISNGVVNLAPDKQRVFSEIARVLKPGGRLYLADVVVQRELTLEARANPDLWAACIGGALPEPELYQIAAEAGLLDARIAERFACFAGTSAEQKVSEDLRVQGVNFFARKP